MNTNQPPVTGNPAEDAFYERVENLESSRHSHEPDIAQSIVPDGHCRICRMLCRIEMLELERAEASISVQRQDSVMNDEIITCPNCGISNLASEPCPKCQKQISLDELPCSAGLASDTQNLLKEIEWSGCVNTETMTVPACPCCYNWKPDSGNADFWNGREERRGHKPDCKLNRFLKSPTIHAIKSPKDLTAELTQLRNAVDELVKQLRKADWNCDCYEDEGHRQSCRTIIIPAAIELANNLPHRKERGV